jgi:arsenate reductase-like glutaredoxin family protein
MTDDEFQIWLEELTLMRSCLTDDEFQDWLEELTLRLDELTLLDRPLTEHELRRLAQHMGFWVEPIINERPRSTPIADESTTLH